MVPRARAHERPPARAGNPAIRREARGVHRGGANAMEWFPPVASLVVLALFVATCKLNGPTRPT
jgi:hypothetical protein